MFLASKDGNNGWLTLLKRIKDINAKGNVSRDSIQLVVSGHIHSAHGIATMETRQNAVNSSTVFVNAAIAKDGYNMGWEPIVIDISVNTALSKRAANRI